MVTAQGCHPSSTHPYQILCCERDILGEATCSLCEVCVETANSRYTYANNSLALVEDVELN